MEFINRILHLLFCVRSASARNRRWLTGAALLAFGGLSQVHPQVAQAKLVTAPYGEVAAQEERTRDSLLTQPQKLTAEEGAATDHFGTAVALSENTLVIGAPENNGNGIGQGSVYVFIRNGASWTLQQKLTVQDGEADSGFGFSVAISGDTVLVGAPLDDVGANVDQGAAYVFARNGTVWTQQQKLTAPDGATNDFFGLSVSLSGNTAAVTAFGDDVGTNENQGSAYIFTRGGTVWTQQQKLTANDGGAGKFFGRSIALSGDTVVVGDSIDQIGSNFDQGSAYVFIRTGTTWTQQQKLTADDGSEGDQFGLSVALSGDTLVVGAPDDDIGGKFDVGSAYIFVRSDEIWRRQQKITADDGEMVDFFGSAVALSGNTVVVGAEDDELGKDLGNLGQGSAYVFTHSIAVWNQRQKLIAEDGDAVDRFGSAVAIGGDTIVVGAPLDDIDANRDQGSAYVFVNPAHQIAVLSCVSAASFLGNSLATESIVAAFGAELATSTEVAAAQPLPTLIGETQISVLDSQGTDRIAPLFFVSPTQINFQIPPGTAAGKAQVTVFLNGEAVAAASPQIELVSPGLFSANASGQGLVVGLALRVRADGSQRFEPLARFDEEKQQFIAAPIDLGPETDQVFLVLFATGLRNRSTLGSVQVRIGGAHADALYAGPQGSFVGLDQINVPLPRDLAGRGEVEVTVMADGVAANPLSVAIQ